MISIEGVPDVRRMWALGSRILVSTSLSAALVSVDPIEEIQLCSDLASAPILAAAMTNDLLVTVREGGVECWTDVEKGIKAASWSATGIVAAAIHGQTVVVASADEVAILKVSNDVTHLG
jgi:DNA damage-binding protein 1